MSMTAVAVHTLGLFIDLPSLRKSKYTESCSASDTNMPDNMVAKSSNFGACNPYAIALLQMTLAQGLCALGW